MTFSLLECARERLAHYAPGFDAELAELPFARRESAAGRAIQRFKAHGPVALLIPASSGGLGAGALDAVRVQYALGARSPSVAVATTMHQFSVASLMALAVDGGAEALLLRAIAEQRLLLASGFAEGVPGRGILDSGMHVDEAPGGIVLSGSKKPCSLAESMDLLTASYTRESADGDELMVALIPARSDGITRRPYWANRALAGAQSDEVRIDKVFVPNRMTFSAGPRDRLERVQIVGFVWFEMLMSAAYLGVCAGLVEQAVERHRWSDSDRVELACDLQLGVTALEGCAREFESSSAPVDDLLARLLLVRYGLERRIARCSDLAHEMLGGASFIGGDDSSLWMLSSRGLPFHPPARISMHANLAAYLRGESFSIAQRDNA